MLTNIEVKASRKHFDKPQTWGLCCSFEWCPLVVRKQWQECHLFGCFLARFSFLYVTKGSHMPTVEKGIRRPGSAGSLETFFCLFMRKVCGLSSSILLTSCVFRIIFLMSKKCFLPGIALALLPFVFLLQLKHGVTWSSSQLLETTGSTDRYLLDSPRLQTFPRAHQLAHTALPVSCPRPAVRPSPRGLGEYLGVFCWFGLKVKQSVLDLRKLTLRNIKRSHEKVGRIGYMLVC